MFYLSKDSDHLLHLPIAPKDIMLSKFIVSLMSEYYILFMFILPCLIGVGVGVPAPVTAEGVVNGTANLGWKYKEVKKIQHFNSIPIGYQYQVSFSIFVDGNMSTFESHEIAHKLEKEITNTLDEVYVTIIHVNPIVIKEEI